MLADSPLKFVYSTITAFLVQNFSKSIFETNEPDLLAHDLKTIGT